MSLLSNSPLPLVAFLLSLWGPFVYAVTIEQVKFQLQFPVLSRFPAVSVNTSNSGNLPSNDTANPPTSPGGDIFGRSLTEEDQVRVPTLSVPYNCISEGHSFYCPDYCGSGKNWNVTWIVLSSGERLFSCYLDGCVQSSESGYDCGQIVYNSPDKACLPCIPSELQYGFYLPSPPPTNDNNDTVTSYINDTAWLVEIDPVHLVSLEYPTLSFFSACPVGANATALDCWSEYEGCTASTYCSAEVGTVWDCENVMLTNCSQYTCDSSNQCQDNIQWGDLYPPPANFLADKGFICDGYDSNYTFDNNLVSTNPGSEGFSCAHNSFPFSLSVITADSGDKSTPFDYVTELTLHCNRWTGPDATIPTTDAGKAETIFAGPYCTCEVAGCSSCSFNPSTSWLAFDCSSRFAGDCVGFDSSGLCIATSRPPSISDFPSQSPSILLLTNQSDVPSSTPTTSTGSEFPTASSLPSATPSTSHQPTASSRPTLTPTVSIPPSVVNGTSVIPTHSPTGSQQPTSSAPPSIQPSVSRPPSLLAAASAQPSISAQPSGSTNPSTMPTISAKPYTSARPSMSSLPTSSPSTSVKPSSVSQPNITEAPSDVPTSEPSATVPAVQTNRTLSEAPSSVPSIVNQTRASDRPAVEFSRVPTASPTVSSAPSVSIRPTETPTTSKQPSDTPSKAPNVAPNTSLSPSTAPSPSNSTSGEQREGISPIESVVKAQVSFQAVLVNSLLSSQQDTLREAINQLAAKVVAQLNPANSARRSLAVYLENPVAFSAVAQACPGTANATLVCYNVSAEVQLVVTQDQGTPQNVAASFENNMNRAIGQGELHQAVVRMDPETPIVAIWAAEPASTQTTQENENQGPNLVLVSVLPAAGLLLVILGVVAVFGKRHRPSDLNPQKMCPVDVPPLDSHSRSDTSTTKRDDETGTLLSRTSGVTVQQQDVC